MSTDLDTARSELSEASRAIAEGGLVSSSAGNVSVRLGDELLITPRRARLGAVDPASCMRVRIEDGAIVGERPGDASPSSETPLHLAAYRTTGAKAIVHTHSLFATALSTVVDELPAIHYALAAFGGSVRVAPYATFGSDELATGVSEALQGRRAALLRNHGAVVVADELRRAVDLAHQLEWLARLYLTARSLGSPALLDQEELTRVAERSVALEYGLGDER